MKKEKSNKQYFKEIDIKNIVDYYDTLMEIDGRKINIDLNFETKSISQKELDSINSFLDKIKEFNKNNVESIKNDFKLDVSMTSDYLNFYLDELDENELAGIIDIKDTVNKRELLLLEKLRLNRIGVYPEASYFATFDYSIDIDGEPCNQLLVVNVNKNGSLDGITWES